jgi:hypothetical protein
MDREKEINNIIEGLNNYCYDAFKNNDVIIILQDGFIKTIPLINIYRMLHDRLMPMTINEVVNLLIVQHKESKNIKEGKYDNLEPMSKDKFNKILSNIKRNNENKDNVVKDLLYDYIFTINSYKNEIFNTSDEEYFKLCEKLTFDIINRIKKIYKISCNKNANQNV